MINDTYLKIESNVFPYYFGDDFLLNIGTSDFVKLNCIQEEVIKCSDGGKTYSEIYYHIIDKFGQDDNENTKAIDASVDPCDRCFYSGVCKACREKAGAEHRWLCRTVCILFGRN